MRCSSALWISLARPIMSAPLPSINSGLALFGLLLGGSRNSSGGGGILTSLPELPPLLLPCRFWMRAGALRPLVTFFFASFPWSFVALLFTALFFSPVLKVLGFGFLVGESSTSDPSLRTRARGRSSSGNFDASTLLAL